MTNEALLARLRAANPVPAPTAIDDPALFAQVTAVPVQARGPRLHRPRLVLALAVLGVAALGGSALGVSSWLGGKAVPPPVTHAEYVRAQHELILPPGYRWPVLHFDPNSMTTVGGGGGYAVEIARNAWECFWVSAIRSGDVRAQRSAHAELDQLLTRHTVIKPNGVPEDWVPAHPPAFPYAVFADDGGLAWIRENYRLAAAGDAGRLAQSCRANHP